MRSRMDRYIESDEVLERTSKNDALYEELYKEKQTPRILTIFSTFAYCL